MDGGLFIAIEGPDGSGKGTITAMLNRWLEEMGYDVHATREPTEKLTGHLLRIALKSKEITPLSDALLFAADRADHVKKEIEPALKSEKIVLCDRYMFSSFAYQAVGKHGVDIEFNKKINEFATIPDLTILLDCPAKVGLERKMQNIYYEPEKFEESEKFAEKVRQNFLSLVEEYDMKVVDSSRSIRHVFTDVKKTVAQKIKEREFKQ